MSTRSVAPAAFNYVPTDEQALRPLQSLLGQISPVSRHELILRIREQIAAGTYETPERFEAAIQALLDSLHDI